MPHNQIQPKLQGFFSCIQPPISASAFPKCTHAFINTILHQDLLLLRPFRWERPGVQPASPQRAWDLFRRQDRLQKTGAKFVIDLGLGNFRFSSRISIDCFGGGSYSERDFVRGATEEPALLSSTLPSQNLEPGTGVREGPCFRYCISITK